MVLLAVMLVETFVNAFFRILVERPEFATHREFVLEGLDPQHENAASLSQKVGAWPSRILQTTPEFERGALASIRRLISQRNRLVHFAYSYDSVRLPGIEIHGVGDVSAYEALDAAVATLAVRSAFDYMRAVLRLRVDSHERANHELMFWTTYAAAQ